MMYVLDSWVWMEYFRGTEKGARFRRLVESEEHATSVVTLAEIADHYARHGLPSHERLTYIGAVSAVLPVTLDVCDEAGRTKWKQRARGVPMGLLDAMIYETARGHDLVLLTGDEDFRGLAGVEFVS
ncbi:MAG: PIN domain-containing protein [Methanobacteriota archaeon]